MRNTGAERVYTTRVHMLLYPDFASARTTDQNTDVYKPYTVIFVGSDVDLFLIRQAPSSAESG